MADTSTFPTLTNVLCSGPTKSRIAGAAIKAGMAVAYATTGINETVHPAIKGTTGRPVGVAIFDAAAGAPVTIATDGATVYAVEGAGVAIDAGHDVEVDDCALGGCIIEYDPAIGTHAATVAAWSLGFTEGDIAANGTGKITISIKPVQTASS